MGLEVAVGSSGVEHRRHEESMVVGAAQQSGERRQVTRPAVGRLDYEHPEHLALVRLGA